MNACQWLYLVEPGQEEAWSKEAVALAEVARSGVPVLPAFVISRHAVGAFFVQPKLKSAVLKSVKSVPKGKPELWAGAAKEIRQHILTTPFAAKENKMIAAFVRDLRDQVLIKKGSGLRITVTELAENRPGHSLTKKVKSVEEAELLIRQLLALSFTEHDLHGRLTSIKAIIPHPPAILVQYGEEGHFSGEAFSHDLEQHDDTTITIRAHHHEHEEENRLTAVDEYRVDRKSLLLLSRKIARHTWSQKRTGRHSKTKQGGADHAVLTDEQALQVARLIKRAQALFTEVVSFHWQYAHSQFVITRVRPLQAEIEASHRGGEEVISSSMPAPLAMGMPGNLGWASGPVRVVTHFKGLGEVKDGDIVVLEHVPADHTSLVGAAALICETGHYASQEAQMAKQLGIPAVLATGAVLNHLKNGQLVTVDGTHGAVYAGTLPAEMQQKPHHESILPVTGTKILATVLDPHSVNRFELAYADGIGLLRSEFILAMLGMHPQDILRKKLHGEYEEVLKEGIEQAVRAVYPHPVIYQLHDVHTAHVIGWKERHEPNPALGYRGTHRLLSEPEVLEMELRALAAVMAQGIDSISIMLPMVRNLEEVHKMYEVLSKSPIAKYGSVKLWVKCETPALAIKADELVQLPIAGVCFDVPALSTLIVGMDKENYQVGHHLDQADAAVAQALEYAIATCRAAGISTTIVAEMEVLRPEIVESAVRSGVSGICVLPADVAEMHGLVASIEQRMLLDHLLAEAPEIPEPAED